MPVGWVIEAGEERVVIISKGIGDDWCGDIEIGDAVMEGLWDEGFGAVAEVLHGG